ncbi:hypothetical protein E4U21_006904 [Claviceps maximensis]|nr:hypothetical protein E4U21_006904 [Claviceps maximensis]
MRFFKVLGLASVVSATSTHDLQHRGMEHADILSLRDTPLDSQIIEQAQKENRTLCVIWPDPLGGDDAFNIMDTFNHKCSVKSIIFMPGPMYNIGSKMSTALHDVHIVQTGRMLWSDDIDHWMSTVSLEVGFQNQTTMWDFTGTNVTWDGHNRGTLDGNGQVWYDWAKSQGNLANRPMNIHFRNLTYSTIKRMRFVQSQMWTMAISYSEHVELEDIYVRSTSNSKWSTLNTDGCDTINSHDITFRRWFVTNGDDAIALKGNSSRIFIYDSEFHDGQGVAIGSVGQYVDRHDNITDFYARNITLVNTAHVSYLKSWAGVSRGYPPNGGGGGLGHATNLVMEDIKIEKMRQQPFFAWQCEHYSGWAGKDCNSSKYKFNQIAWRRVSGTVAKDVKELGWFQCSAGAGGCDDFEAQDIDVKYEGSDKKLDVWHCENVHGNKGFKCSSPPQESRADAIR